jgi:hypothetical protein
MDENIGEIEFLKDSIEKMDKMHHIEILKILKKHKSVKINENKNGIYINISLLPPPIVCELNNYLSYVNEQEKTISKLESQKEVFKNTFFSEKDNKDEMHI